MGDILYKNKIRLVLARILLVTYTIMLLVMYTHIHYSTDSDRCVSESSINHINHDKYFSSHNSIDHECFICKLLSTPYLFPRISHFAIFITFIGSIYIKKDQKDSVYYNVIKSSRAPPLFYFKYS